MNRLQSILPGAIVVAALLASPISASAQSTAGSDGANARIHWGPLALDPKLAIKNVGVDSNVFNTAAAPQQDFNITAGPQLDEWTRIGRVYLSGQTTVGFTYYKKATNQRSVDFGQKGRADLRLVRFTPHLSAGYLTSRERPNFELDARVRRHQNEMEAGLVVALGVRTSVDFAAVYDRIKYDDATEFEGAFLAAELNRTSRGVNTRFNFEHSPLTTFVIKGDLQQDRFDVATIRDSNTVKISAGVEFKPDALLSGTAYLGVRSFMVRDDAVQDFTGLVTELGLRFAPSERLKFAVNAKRDIDYSFDANTPYFVSTGADVTVHQGIGGAWDIAGRLGLTRLGYRGLVGEAATSGEFDRNDGVRVIGTGIGRTMNNGLRLGFDFDHARRTSEIALRQYSGFRAGGSVTYGF